MPKPDRKPDPDFEPDYNTADVEYEEAPLADDEPGADVEYDAPTDPDYDEVEAEYELEIADPDYDEVVQVVEAPAEADPAPVLAVAPKAAFAFEVGRPVLPVTQSQPHPVVWRGHLLERHPATGLLHRVPVYQLADGYWDCYREEELQVA